MQVNCPDILQWIPATWDQVVGNRSAKRLFRSTLKSLRRQMAEPTEHNGKMRILLTGPSQSGKSSLVELFGRSMMCRQLDPKTLDPCPRRCPYCQADFARRGLSDWAHLKLGLDTWVLDGINPRFVPVDYTGIVERQDLRDVIDPLGKSLTNREVVVVFLDEVHRLVKRRIDEVLLRSVERMPFTWILVTAEPQELEQMFKNRFV